MHIKIIAIDKLDKLISDKLLSTTYVWISSVLKTNKMPLHQLRAHSEMFW